jgi:predicted SAM-dependent methyltransferase
MKSLKRKILDIGCGKHKAVPEAIGLDVVKLEGVDVVHNLNKFPYPFKASFFDEIYAFMVLEHVEDLMRVMKELHRILKPEGLLHIKVPYYLSSVAFQDPTHRNYFTDKTFHYFTKDCELNYYSDCRFVIVSQSLYSNSASFIEKVRNLIPFRSILRFFLMNMYDEIHLTLRKK